MHDDPLPLFRWTPTPRGEVVPFPAVRRRPAINSAARNAARFAPATAYRMIDAKVAKYREKLARFGVDPAVADIEVQAYHAALLTTLNFVLAEEERA